MGPKKWIDKKKAETFQVVNRSHDDSRFYDESASSGVLVPRKDLNTKSEKEARKQRWIGRQELENEFDGRNNEGEAALYGITFDDSQYDYMQHLKPIDLGLDGADAGDGVFVAKDSLTGSQRPTKEFAFKDEIGELLPDERSRSFRERFKAQQAVPDELQGLQPDMDPRLREVLEALEDEEYVEEDDDFFGELVRDGEATETQFKKSMPKEELVQKPGEADWEFAFRKFKLDSAESADDLENGSEMSSDFGPDSDDAGSTTAAAEAVDTVGDLPQQKRKRKIGAKTDLTGFSMSSSANFRNKGLSLLDDRFDKIEEEYEKESESGEEEEFDITKERGDFESIMDDFLDNYQVDQGKLYKRR